MTSARTLAGVAAFTVGLVGLADTAAAHLRLLSPASRYGDEQKAGPCGRAGGVRSTNVATFRPGETITLVWDEFINHPGHFRVSFDDDGDDDFVDPAGYDDLYTASTVMLDNIADKSGGMYEVPFTLPMVECDNCTLQVIQVMTDKPPYGDGNDIYYQCVDLILTGEPMLGPDAGPSNGASDAGSGGGDPQPGRVSGGCSSGGGSAGALTGLAMLLLLGVARRRRSN
jgi:MYXO-CTERM domain-containing protein